MISKRQGKLPPPASLARPSARHPPGGGLSFAGRWAAPVPVPAATACLAIFSVRFRERRCRTVLPDPSASSGRLVPRRCGSCLVIANRRLLPKEGVGSACQRLRRIRRGGVPCRDLPRPPSPSAVTHAPGNEVPADPSAASRCSLRSRLSLSALISLPTTQAGTRQPFGAAGLSALTAPAAFLAGGGSRLVAENRRPRQKKQPPFRCCVADGRCRPPIVIATMPPSHQR